MDGSETSDRACDASGAEVSPVDVRLLALSVVLEPALALARVSGLQLDDLHTLVSIGYLREFQRGGLSLRGMQRRVGKSLRTLARLSRQAGSEGPPLEASQRVGWRRRIVRTLAKGAETLDDLDRELVDASREEIADTIEELIELGILSRSGTRVALASEHLSLVREDLDHRLESLRHFVSAVAHVVYRRFYFADPEAEAFARVFTFSVPRERLPQIRERLYQVLREEVFAADAAAEADPDSAVQASTILGLVETPTDLPWRKRV